MGRGQAALGAAAGTSSCDRGSQTGPQGAPRRLLPGVPRPRAALAFVCSPAVCGVPSPPCLPQAPATTVSFHPDLGLQVAASLTPGQRGPRLSICAPLGMSVSPPSSGVWDLPGSGLSERHPSCVRSGNGPRAAVTRLAGCGRDDAQPFQKLLPRLLLSLR